MEESTTYQSILRKGELRGEERGRVKEACRLLLRTGVKRFGEADATVQRRVSALTDIDALERLCERVLEVSSWDELLANVPG